MNIFEKPDTLDGNNSQKAEFTFCFIKDGAGESVTECGEVSLLQNKVTLRAKDKKITVLSDSLVVFTKEYKLTLRQDDTAQGNPTLAQGGDPVAGQSGTSRLLVFGCGEIAIECTRLELDGLSFDTLAPIFTNNFTLKATYSIATHPHELTITVKI